MIIFHDPDGQPSREFIASLPPGSYYLVDCSDPAQVAPYAGGAIRSFPSLVLIMDDDSYGGVDCQDQGINTYDDALSLSTAMLQKTSKRTGAISTVPADARVWPLPLYPPGSFPVPPLSYIRQVSA